MEDDVVEGGTGDGAALLFGVNLLKILENVNCLLLAIPSTS